MRKKAGTCYVCGKAVYVLSGKDLPKEYRGWTSQKCDFIGRSGKGHPKRHHHCETAENLE